MTNNPCSKHMSSSFFDQAKSIFGHLWTKLQANKDVQLPWQHSSYHCGYTPHTSAQQEQCMCDSRWCISVCNLQVPVMWSRQYNSATSCWALTFQHATANLHVWWYVTSLVTLDCISVQIHQCTDTSVQTSIASPWLHQCTDASVQHLSETTNTSLTFSRPSKEYLVWWSMCKVLSHKYVH